MIDTSIWALIQYLYLYLIFELEAMYWKKADEDARQYIKMYVAEVSAKIANDIPKNVKKQIILFHSKLWSNL